MSPLEGPSTITDFFREPFSSRVIFERLSTIITSQIDRKASIAIAHRWLATWLLLHNRSLEIHSKNKSMQEKVDSKLQ